MIGERAVGDQFVVGNTIDEPLVMDVWLSRGGGCDSAAARRSLRSTPGALGHDSSKTIGETAAGAANAASRIDLDLATHYFFHQNTLFSVAGLTDESGDLVEAIECDPWSTVAAAGEALQGGRDLRSTGRHVRITDDADADGVVNFSGDDLRVAFAWTASGGSTGAPVHGSPFLFTGQRFDPESGLYYYKNRYYKTERGRFVSKDMLAYVDGPNVYLYVKGSPTNAVDALGLWLKVVNCVGVGTTAEAGFFPGLGGKATLSVTGKICDCCNTSTGRFWSKNYSEIAINVKVKVWHWECSYAAITSGGAFFWRAGGAGDKHNG